MFALTFNERVRAALPPTAPFTTDASTLRTAMAGALLTWGRTALYDAISAGLAYVAHGRHEVRVLVIVSDGGDNASSATFEEVLSATQVSNTVIYSIAVADPVERDASPKRLKQLAEVSGGDAFKPRTIAGVGDVLRNIARDIRNTYTIGYAPADTTRDGRFRRIQVLVKTPAGQALRVRTRQGYALGER
jgi:VWFA-related protein